MESGCLSAHTPCANHLGGSLPRYFEMLLNSAPKVLSSPVGSRVAPGSALSSLYRVLLLLPPRHLHCHR